MKRFQMAIPLLAAASALLVAALACSILPSREPAQGWTPVPSTRISGQPTLAGTVPPTPVGRFEVTALPAATFTSSAWSVATVSAASATPVAKAAQSSGSQATATPDPHLVVITEEDVAKSVSSGGAERAGVTVEGLAVRFRDGKISVNASQMGYGAMQVKNLAIVGRLVAKDGVLQFETESVSPRGLVTAFIPTMINQMFQQSTSQWYIEEVRTLDGRVELRIR